MDKRYIAALSCAIGASLAVEAKDDRPNIILIMADDLGWGDLHCYGARDIQTPNIDRLANEGMQFMNFHANSSVSSPSRAALMTGKFPDLVGVPGVIRDGEYWNFGYFNPTVKTLPEILSENGYNTSLIGKWHLGESSPNLPNERGFGYFKGWLEGMIDSYTVHTRSGKNYMRLNNEEIQTSGQHATDLFTDWAVERIKDCEDDGKPMFLFVGYTAPHDPIEPKQEYLDKVLEREKDITEKRARIAALIEHMDEGVGKILNELEETGRLDNSLVIFVSDNGGVLNHGASNGHFRGGKGDMWEGGLAVSCIAWQKGKISPAKNNNMLMIMDWYPTILNAAGLKKCVTKAIDGRNFSDLLYGTQREDKDRVLVWMRREGGDAMGNAYYAIRFGKYKMLQNSPYQKMQFIDMESDPLEEVPIEESKIDKKTRWTYYGELQRHIKKAGRIQWQKPEDRKE